jgi:MFS family permease
MLASITPLGERSRGFSWGLTASAFAVGAVAAGALGGALGGAIGSLAPAGRWRDVAALVLLAAALAVDASPLRRRLPTTRRQVNEDWLTRYRGWVYGIAFGAQLGTGLATIVTSAAVYAAVLGAVLCGTAAAGAVVGAAFGATRALALLPARRAADPASLVRLHDRLGRAQVPAARAAVAAEAAAIALVVVGLL